MENDKKVNKDLTSNLTKSEEKDLEKLTEIFGKFNSIFIDGGFVYGQNSSPRREYLGTKEEYHKYRELKHKKLGKDKQKHKREFIPETYNAFNLD